MEDDRNNLVNNKNTAMPEDFWQMVQHERARAQAQVERRRQKVYQAFSSQDEQKNNRVPMPKDFWEAMASDVEVAVSLPLDPFVQQNSTPSQQAPILEETLPLLDLVDKDNGVKEIKETQEDIIEEDREEVEFFETEENDIIYLEQESIGLTFKEAALMILTREKRPMTAREIANIAISEGLVLSTGKTPDASVAGQIYTDIRRYPDKTPFASVGHRTYTLKSLCRDEGNSQTAKATFLDQESTGTVISGNFPWQEEPKQANQSLEATQPDSLDSNLAIEINNQESSNSLTSSENGNIDLENSQKDLIELKNSNEEAEETAEEATSENKKMGFKQAAFYLLNRMQRPMTAKEIVTIALEESLIDSSSKKPDSSLAGQIYTDFQRFGEKSVFRQVAPRTYALAEWYKNET